MSRLYRVLRCDEGNPRQSGLSAKDPGANMALEEHVERGSWNSRSQFISCTDNLESAKSFGRMKKTNTFRVVTLDRGRIETDQNIRVYDVSNGTAFRSRKANKYSSRFNEVVLEGNVPKEYVIEVKTYLTSDGEEIREPQIRRRQIEGSLDRSAQIGDLLDRQAQLAAQIDKLLEALSTLCKTTWCQ